MPAVHRLIYVAALLLLPHASPAHSLGLGVTAGAHYRETDLKGRLDLDKDAIWQAYASFADIHLGDPDSELLSRQYVLGLDHSLSPRLDAGGELIYEHDSGSISSLGVAGRLYYSFLRDPDQVAALTGPSIGDDALDRDIEAALSDDLGASPGDFGGILIGLDARSYSLPDGQSSFTVTNPKGKVISSGIKENSISLGQLHPSLGVDLSLWDGAVTPSLSGGYYFYSQPVYVNGGSGTPYYGASPAAARVGSLMTGLLRASWQAGLGLRLPLGLGVAADYGQQLLLDPEAWVDIYGLSLNKELFKHLRVDLGGRYSMLNGDGQLLGSVGLRYRF